MLVNWNHEMSSFLLIQALNYCWCPFGVFDLNVLFKGGFSSIVFFASFFRALNYLNDYSKQFGNFRAFSSDSFCLAYFCLNFLKFFHPCLKLIDFGDDFLALEFILSFGWEFVRKSILAGLMSKVLPDVCGSFLINDCFLVGVNDLWDERSFFSPWMIILSKVLSF